MIEKPNGEKQHGRQNTYIVISYAYQKSEDIQYVYTISIAGAILNKQRYIL